MLCHQLHFYQVSSLIVTPSNMTTTQNEYSYYIYANWAYHQVRDALNTGGPHKNDHSFEQTGRWIAAADVQLYT